MEILLNPEDKSSGQSDIRYPVCVHFTHLIQRMNETSNRSLELPNAQHTGKT